MRRLIIWLAAMMLLFTIVDEAAAKANKQTVVFYVNIHCQGCIDKIYKTIAFEKGVKDLKCDLNKKMVEVTYDANKTDVPTLQKAFKAIGKPAYLTKEELRL